MGPYVRIVLRYAVGAVIGYQIGEQIASDPDVVAVATAGAAALVGIATEATYALARKLGWRT